MEENRESLKKYQTKFCFSDEKDRVNLPLFSRFGAAKVYLSGESRPSLAEAKLEDYTWQCT